MTNSAGTAANGSQDRENGIDPSGEPPYDTFSRMQDGHITLWSAGMQRRYGFTAEQAVGQISHRLLRTSFPFPLPDIEATLLKDNSWLGGMIHRHADGRAILVVSRWNLQRHGGKPDEDTVTEVHADANGVGLADLFAIMANELSQPLAAIANYVNGARRSLQRHAPDAATTLHGMALAAAQIDRGAAQVKLMRGLAAELRRIA